MELTAWGLHRSLNLWIQALASHFLTKFDTVCPDYPFFRSRIRQIFQ
jgi:hypothetical protein